MKSNKSYIYSLYQEREMTRKVFDNITNSIKL